MSPIRNMVLVKQYLPTINCKKWHKNIFRAIKIDLSMGNLLSNRFVIIHQKHTELDNRLS